MNRTDLDPIETNRPRIGRRLKAASAALALTAVGVGFGSVGCSSDTTCTNTVVARARPGVDFGDYETFAIKDVDGSGFGGAGGAGHDIPDDVLTNIAVANEEAAQQLEALGLKKVDPDKETPDLWIGTAGATEENSGVVWECVPGWYWWGWYMYWDSCAWLEPIHVDYTVGTLFVALVDSGNEEVVFGGFAQGVVGCSDDVEGQIETAVDAIFDKYPVEE
jgi:hypothetical protein